MLGAQCTVALSYYNPTAQTVELPSGDANHFSPAPDDRRQPRVFAPGLVQSVQQLQFDCSDSAWQLEWTLAVGQQTCSASVSAANLC
jgi:enoyl reductase-like protein